MRTTAITTLTLALLAIACGGGGEGGGPGPTAGPNLVENPSGEQDARGYVGHNGATISHDPSTASDGAASVKVAVSDVQGAGVQVWKADGVTMMPVTPNATYEFSVDVKGDLGKSMRLEVLWHRADGAFLETSLGPVFFLPLGGFNRFSFVAPAPGEAGLSVLQVVTDTAPGGPFNMWVDNVHFQQRSTTASPTPTGMPGR